MGLEDVKHHYRNSHHKIMEYFQGTFKITSKVDSFFTSTLNSSDVNNSANRAKITQTNFLVQYNLSFLTTNYLALMYSKMLPESKRAWKFKSARTKAAAVLKNEICPVLQENLFTYIQNRVFVICNDGSSDTGIKNMNPVSAAICNVNNSWKVQT